MAWLPLASGSRLMVLALRNHAARNATVQVRHSRRFTSEGGKQAFVNAMRKLPVIEKIDFKKVESVMKPVGEGVKAVIRLDPDFRVILSVVPVVLLTAYYLWKKHFKDILGGEVPASRVSHALLLPQPQAVGHLMKTPVLNSNSSPELNVCETQPAGGPQDGDQLCVETVPATQVLSETPVEEPPESTLLAGPGILSEGESNEHTLPIILSNPAETDSMSDPKPTQGNAADGSDSSSAESEPVRHRRKRHRRTRYSRQKENEE